MESRKTLWWVEIQKILLPSTGAANIGRSSALGAATATTISAAASTAADASAAAAASAASAAATAAAAAAAASAASAAATTSAAATASIAAATAPANIGGDRAAAAAAPAADGLPADGRRRQPVPAARLPAAAQPVPPVLAAAQLPGGRSVHSFASFSFFLSRLSSSETEEAVLEWSFRRIGSLVLLVFEIENKKESWIQFPKKTRTFSRAIARKWGNDCNVRLKV